MSHPTHVSSTCDAKLMSARPYLLWCDLEATGLGPESAIVEYAFELWAPVDATLPPPDPKTLVYHGYQIAFAADSVLPLPLEPVKWEEGALAMHLESGLLAKVVEATKRVPGDPKEILLYKMGMIERCLPPIDYSEKNIDPKTGKLIETYPIYLAGSSVHFDLGCLRRTIGNRRSISHRVLDVSALELAELTAGRPTLKDAGGPPHRARADLERSQRMFLRWLDRHAGDVANLDAELTHARGMLDMAIAALAKSAWPHLLREQVDDPETDGATREICRQALALLGLQL